MAIQLFHRLYNCLMQFQDRKRGVANILTMLGPANEFEEEPYLQQVERICSIINSLPFVNSDIHFYTNCYYLTGSLERSLMSKKCQSTIGDRKIIKVISLAYRLLILD